MNVLILVSVLGLLSLFAGLSDSLRKYTLPLATLGLIVASALNALNWNMSLTHFFGDMLNFDHYAVAFIGVILLISILVFSLAKNQFSFDESSASDFQGIMLFTIAGAIMMIAYSNIAMLFVGIETLSISLYTLAGSRKDNLKSNEAALKYFLLGAFATGFLLFGIAMIYGASGTFNLSELAAYVNSGKDLPYLFHAGLLLLMIGLLFKVSAAPFHFWAPDVYEGSPNIVTAFMATMVKVTAFAAFYRLFAICFAPISEQWSVVLGVVTVLTLLIGNFSALAQNEIKRLLAFSGIANAGFMLLAILALKQDAAGSLLYYSLAYASAALGAFAVLMLLSEDGKSFSFDSLKGLSKSNPVVAVLFTIVMLSMAGIPPMSGFFGKYFILYKAIQGGYLAISLIAIVSSVVGIYYYFKVIAAIYSAPVPGSELVLKGKKSFILVVCALLSILLGFCPDLVLELL